MARLSYWEVRRHLPAAVVGSSLGALVALDVARRGLAAPLVLVAPALGFGSRWLEKLPEGDPIPFFHHGEERELPIHRRFFEEMSRLDSDREPPPVPTVVVMGTRDESVPFDQVRGIWRKWENAGTLPPGSRFIEVSGGDHGLVEHADRIAQEIRALTRIG